MRYQTCLVQFVYLVYLYGWYLNMTRSEKISEVVTAIVVLIFALGWMDFGQGTQYTWWNLIHMLAN